jgi:uncharacterized protein
MADPPNRTSEAASGGRQQIQAYGGGGFRVSGVRFGGSVLVHAEHTDAWPVESVAEIPAPDVAALATGAPAGTLVIIGCGARFVPMPPSLREALAAAGVHAEWMDTGAACRTFNVLVAEGREVRAALLAIA